uniref:Uncharacterized protein n=1 Tax=Arion vulgaris TaxID=1028688 RepID=A0A0B7BH34_9EUPU
MTWFRFKPTTFRAQGKRLDHLAVRSVNQKGQIRTLTPRLEKPDKPLPSVWKSTVMSPPLEQNSRYSVQM